MSRTALTVRVHEDLAEQVRRAAYWLRVNQNTLLTAAIRREVERLQSDANQGKPFKARPEAPG